MSLFGVLNIGNSAMTVAQAQLQVTGNNIANAGNASYTREVAETSPSADQSIGNGIEIGTGVDLTGITRQIDEALQSRLNSATSDNSAATTTQGQLSQVQSVFNALSGQDLSSQMSSFFSSWSSLANQPQDAGLRQVVLQQGTALAGFLQQMNTQLGSLQSTATSQITSLTANANQLAQQIANLNGQINTAEGGSTQQANSLRDQRDAVVTQLAQLVNVTTVNQGSSENVYIGSEPLVIGTTNRGLSTKQQTVNGALQTEVTFTQDNSTAPVTGGQIGGLMGSQQTINSVVSQTNSIAHNLIFELNKLQSSGQGTQGYTSVTSTNLVADPTAALTDPKAGLAFTPNNGSFVVHVTNTATGLSTSTLVQVNLTGSPTDTSLNSLATSLNGISNVSATVTAGQLTINAGPNTQISFSQDSSGVLAALGINTFFTGKNASDIAVNSTLNNNPALLAAAQNGDPADNTNALAIAQLGTQPLVTANGQSLTDLYQSMVNGVSTAAATATNNAQATLTIQQTLQTQQESLSGVSLNEETINMLQQQTAFQGAARVISTVDDMMQTLLAMPF